MDRFQACEVGRRLPRVGEERSQRPVSLRYDDALEVALAYGWIDGQGRSRDEGTYAVRFTRRRSRSVWSKRNTLAAERLIQDGRMHAAGLAEVERAKKDGRWSAA